MLCDAHTHFFSHDFFATLAREAAAATGRAESELLNDIGARNGIELPPEGVAEHMRRWLGELDRNGVDRAVTFASVPPEASATPLAVLAAAERHRDVTFVLPHFGGGFFREALIAGAQSPNVWVETSSSNSWIATQTMPLDLKDVFSRALGVFGSERILFGTDSSTFPRGWRRDVLEVQESALDELRVNAAAKKRIFGENLLGLLAT